MQNQNTIAQEKVFPSQIRSIQDLVGQALAQEGLTIEQVQTILAKPQNFQEKFRLFLRDWTSHERTYPVRCGAVSRVYGLIQPGCSMLIDHFLWTLKVRGMTLTTYDDHVLFNASYPWVATSRDILSGPKPSEFSREGYQTFNHSCSYRDGHGWRIHNRDLKGIYERYFYLVRLK